MTPYSCKQVPPPQYAFFNRQILHGLILCSATTLLATLSVAASPTGLAKASLARPATVPKGVGRLATSTQTTLIPLNTRRGMVFDHVSQHLYIGTSNGQVKSYNLSTNQFDATYNVGSILNGIDITSNDGSLIIAENNAGVSQGTFYRLDLSTGIVTNINYAKDNRLGGEGGAWDVAIAGNGLALVTTLYPGSGWTPVRQIDLATNAITIRSDVPGSGPYNMVYSGTQVHRSADRSRLFFLEGNIFSYSSSTNSFSSAVQNHVGSNGAALSRNGSIVGTLLNGAALDTAAGYNYLHSFNAIDSGITFDAESDVFYGVNSSTDQIIAFDSTTFAEKFRLDIGEDIGSGITAFGTGYLVASQDGRYLALATPSGIRIFSVPPANPPPPPSPTFGTPKDMVFDHTGTHLYITTAEGLVWPYRLSTRTFDSPYNLGGSLRGIDIASDDSFLLVAQYDTGLTEGAVQRVDLSSGSLNNIDYPLTSSELGAWAVAIGSNNLAMVTTDFDGSGWTPLRQINLTTNLVTSRTDAPGSGPSGMVRGKTQIHRSADQTRMYFLEPDISSGPLFTYSAAGNTFGPSAQTNGFLDSVSAAVNRNGMLLGTRFNYVSVDTAPGFNHVQSIGTIDGGIAFDAVTDTLYGVNSVKDQIIGYDTNTFAEKFRFDIGEDVDSRSTQFGPGTLVASQDGHYLALQTPTTIRIYTVPAVQLVSVASIKNHGVSSFSLDLPLDGARGIECRSGGADEEYTIVFSFGQALTSVGSASLTLGTGTVSSSSIDSSDARRYIVNLSGVTNVQYIKVTLSNVNDIAGNHTDLISQQVGILIGDTNGDGFINSADIGQTKSQSGQPVTQTNFREDVNADGFINSADIGLVKSKSGTGISPP